MSDFPTLLILAALAASIALNVYLIRAVYSHKRRYNSSTCRKCGYDVRVTVDGRCPECGELVVLRTAHVAGALTRCNFCGKSSKETGPQAEGPGGFYVCAPCSELCHEAILKNRNSKNSTTMESNFGGGN